MASGWVFLRRKYRTSTSKLEKMSSNDIESPSPAGVDARAAGEANNVPAVGDSKVLSRGNIVGLLLQLYLLNALALALSFTIGGSPLLHAITSQTLLSALLVIIIRAARLDGNDAIYNYVVYKKRRWKCLVIYCWVLLVLSLAYDLFYYVGNVPQDRRAGDWVLLCYGACIAGMVLTVIRLSVALCRMPLTSIGCTYAYYYHPAAAAA